MFKYQLILLPRLQETSLTITERRDSAGALAEYCAHWRQNQTKELQVYEERRQENKYFTDTVGSIVHSMSFLETNDSASNTSASTEEAVTNKTAATTAVSVDALAAVSMPVMMMVREESQIQLLQMPRTQPSPAPSPAPPPQGDNTSVFGKKYAAVQMKHDPCPPNGGMVFPPMGLPPMIPFPQPPLPFGFDFSLLLGLIITCIVLMILGPGTLEFIIKFINLMMQLIPPAMNLIMNLGFPDINLQLDIIARIKLEIELMKLQIEFKVKWFMMQIMLQIDMVSFSAGILHIKSKLPIKIFFVCIVDCCVLVQAGLPTFLLFVCLHLLRCFQIKLQLELAIKFLLSMLLKLKLALELLFQMISIIQITLLALTLQIKLVVERALKQILIKIKSIWDALNIKFKFLHEMKQLLPKLKRGVDGLESACKICTLNIKRPNYLPRNITVSDEFGLESDFCNKKCAKHLEASADFDDKVYKSRKAAVEKEELVAELMALEEEKKVKEREMDSAEEKAAAEVTADARAAKADVQEAQRNVNKAKLDVKDCTEENGVVCSSISKAQLINSDKIAQTCMYALVLRVACPAFN